MSKFDRLSQIRDIVGAPRTAGNRPPDSFGFSKDIDTYSCYKDTQQHRFSIVGPTSPTHILWQTFDLRDGAWVLSRWVLLDLALFLELMEALLQAEIREADLSTTPASAWPEFPILLAEIPSSDGSAVRVLINAWKGYLEIQVSRVLADGSKRNGQWCKYTGFDSREILRLLLAAFDASKGFENVPPAQSHVAEDDDFGF